MTQLSTNTEFDDRQTTNDEAEIHEPSLGVEARAYARYLERGCVDGFDLDDWLAAEAELRGGTETGTLITNRM